MVEKETEQCHCTEDNPCTSSSNCINRAIYTECSKDCHVGEKCQNQRISLNQVPVTVTFFTGSRGWGLKSKSDLKSGDFIVEYIGEVLNRAMVQERLKKAQETSVTSFYFLTLEGNLIIDASKKSNHARFINHSCKPNCETQKWTVNGETRIGIFAIEDIAKGTELTFDYRLDSWGNEKRRCLCGAANCSGFLGDKPKQQSTTCEKFIGKGIKRKRSLSSLSGKSTDREKIKKSRKSLEPSKESMRKSSHKAKEENGALIENSSADPYDDQCFVCKDGGDLIICDYKDCCKVYHMDCAKLEDLPTNEFYCSRHTCDICGIEAFYMCGTCPVSYCHEHQEGHIIVTDITTSFVCVDNCYNK